MPPRPTIAPGLRVLARPDGWLQVGLTVRHRLRIADSPAARRTLAALDRGEPPPSDRASRRVLAQLGPALRDAEELVRPGLAQSEVAAVGLRHPGTLAARLAARQATRVAVHGDVGVDPRPLLARSGITLAAPGDASVALVLSLGEPDREQIDRLVRDHLAHLLVRVVEGETVVGPFVLPGQTACVRCLDAHRAEDDPCYPALISPAARLGTGLGLGEPADSALTTIAVAWAVRDLIRYAEGDPVSTWSATISLDPDQDTFGPLRWRPHPACGCGWGRWGAGSGAGSGDEGASVTMGA